MVEEKKKRGPGRPRGGDAPPEVRAYWRRMKRQERERKNTQKG